MTKAELRREMRTRLATLGETRAKKSQAIVATVARHPKFAGSRRIALFSPLPSEPDIEGLWEGTPHQFCYPRVARGGMEFVDVPSRDHLTVAQWHGQIREDNSPEARIIPPAEIEIIVIPGLAFTSYGERLGRGGGYYDRYLALLPAATFKIGVCFGVQIVETLPMEPHDQRVDAVATEEGIVH